MTMTAPVHARVHRTAGAHLPQARRARDRRHGGVHPLPPRRRGQQGRLREGPADKDREAADGFDGSWVAHPDLVPVAASPSTRSSATARTRRTGCARTSTSTAADLIAVDSLDAKPTYDGPAQRRPGRHPLHRGLAARHRRGRHLQPHGGRGHRRDLPLADLAVDQRGRRVRARRREGHRRTWPARSPPANWPRSARRSARRPSRPATGSRPTTCC